MISRIVIPLLLIIILPDAYIYMRYLRGKVAYWLRLMWWIPCLLLLAYTVFMALQRNFAPYDMDTLNIYLFLFGLIAVPKFLFALCSLVGLGVCRLLNCRRTYATASGLLFAAAAVYILLYGSTIGFRKIEVRHVDYYSEDLPPEFDGYRIAQFSDAHVGTYGYDRTDQMRAAVDTINAQQADVIVFTGDLQNMRPREIYPYVDMLGSLKAADGVFSVLGNHDYADYVDLPEEAKAANCRMTVFLQHRMGWRLLQNEHAVIRRGADSIVIAGMENDGNGKHFPQKGDVRKTMRGVGRGAFTVMLEHDPTAWRRKILPQTEAQLTLSGHTHGMQFELFGWSPVSFVYREWGGVYYEGSRAINVSTGLGGFIPFRFGVPGEVVVITLHRK